MNIEKAIHEALLKNLRDDLDVTLCIRCRLNVWGCCCTMREIDHYIKTTPMKVRYAR